MPAHQWEQTIEEEREDTMRGRFITFAVGRETYAIEIRYVTEIVGIQPINNLPETPDHIKGVINLRGKIIPVVDMRLKFKKEPMEYNDRTCIIVVDIQGDEQATRMGVIVDAVSEVLNVREEDIEPAPSFGDRARTEYILGMANMDERVKLLLDIDKVFDPEEIADLEKAA